MTPLRARLNNHHVCIVCRSRADNIGVGRPNAIGWICNPCGIDRAEEIMQLAPKKLDEIEKRALKTVRAKLPDEGVTVRNDEIFEFLEWLIEEFGLAIRAEVDSGRAPF